MGRSRVPIRCLQKLLERYWRGPTCWFAAGLIIPWPALGLQLHSILPPHRLWWGLGLTVAFAASARLLRAVNLSGAIAGGLLAFLLFVGGGAGAFVTLVAVFLLAWMTTRMGYRRKRLLGTAEHHGGRTASQIIANVGIAATAALISLSSHHPAAWLVASSAALAEAASDTASSEVGQAVGTSAYLITDFRPVPIGTDGGISVQGTLAGIAGALLVATVSWATGMIAPHWLLPVAGAGVLGMFVDSFLGASLERRGLLNNDVVNFLSTVTSAAFALFLYWSRHGEFRLP